MSLCLEQKKKNVCVQVMKCHANEAYTSRDDDRITRNGDWEPAPHGAP